MRFMNDYIRKLSHISRSLQDAAKDPTLTRDKSIELNKEQDDAYKKYIFMKKLAIEMRCNDEEKSKKSGS